MNFETAPNEILGLDPLYVTNEGKCQAIVGEEATEHPVGRDARWIGG